ncbi:MAG: hypothetical protein LUG13_08355 [Oscillospiraceae bacterium]|nr:hypothetical protein [Oscillospiraceae bacterium]
MDNKEIALHLALKAMEQNLLPTEKLSYGSSQEKAQRNAERIAEMYKQILNGLKDT